MGCSKGLVAVAAAVLLMPISAILVRHSKRHPSSDRDYLSLTVNLCIELVKCALSLLLYLAFRRSMSDTNDVNLPAVSSRAAADLEEEEDDDGRASCASSAWRQLRGSLPYAVPAFLYLIDNNVFFLVMRLINPATYHLMSNIKVIFVALLFRFALRRAINRIQWVALVLLVVGLVVSELDALHAMEAAAAISAVNATCATLAPVAAAVGLALLPPLTDNSASDSRKSTPPSFAVNQGVRPPIDAAPQWLVAMGRKFDFGEPRSKPFPHSHAISSTDPVGAVSHLSNTRPAQIVALPVYVPLRPPTLSRSSSSSPTSSPAAASSSPPPPVPPLHATTTAELSLAFALVCAMCVCSSIANIAIEHLYKSRAQNVLLQNVQLYAWGAAFNAACLLLRDADTIARDGAFVGFTPIVWAIVFSSALVGLSVAFILKYSDNIGNVWAHAAALVVTSLASAALFSFRITLSFVCGCVIVKLCCYLYHAAADEDENEDGDGGHGGHRGEDGGDRNARAASSSAYAPVSTDGRANAVHRLNDDDDGDDGDLQSASEMATGGGARYVSVSVRDQDANGVNDDSDDDDNADNSDRMGGDDDIDDLGFGGGRGGIGLTRTSPQVGANPSPLSSPPFAPAAAAAASLRFSSPGLVGHANRASGARSAGAGGKLGGGGSSALKPTAHSASSGEIEM